MRKTKATPDSFWSVRSLLFITLWAGSYGTAALLIDPLLDLIGRIVGSPSLYTVIAILGVCLIVVCAAMVQVQLVERLLKHSMRGWMLYFIVGAFLTMLGFGATTNGMIILTSNPPIYPDFFDHLIFFTAVLVPLPLVQAAWLRRRVRWAWFYPLIGLLAALWLAITLPEGVWGWYLVGTLLIYSLLQGIVLRYLWTQTRYTEKAKVDFDVDSQASIDTRAARLQASESLPVTWHTRDEQASQHKAQ